VCSSMIDTILIGLPSVVTSNWKSTAHTLLGASAVRTSAVEVPRRLRRRRCGTRKPSSRQSRWIRRIRVLRGICGGFVALGSTVLPGHPAGEPFADPPHALEVTNSCPSAFRA
jgi:hypothetical protein